MVKRERRERVFCGASFFLVFAVAVVGRRRTAQTKKLVHRETGSKLYCNF
jgi:hypothetical protein